MAEIDLLTKYPKPKRNVTARGTEKTPEDIRIARQFGKEFFDGSRSRGYGGYYYDGRWVPVVRDFIRYYGLTNDSAVLDIGSGKGFMIHDFLYWLPFMRVSGIDVSQYAIENSIPKVRACQNVGDAKDLSRFGDNSFDLVISINSIHNLPIEECKQSLREIMRVTKKNAYITVDAYTNKEEYERMMQWNLTAQTILHVDEWKKLFLEVGYTGDYYWFIP